MIKELENLETLKDMLIGNGCNNFINDYVNNLILPIKQALLKAQELKSENNVLLEENKDLYVELAFANKQYKELIECAKQYKKVLSIIKKKVMPLVSVENGRVWDNELYSSNELTQEESDLLMRFSKEKDDE